MAALLDVAGFSPCLKEKCEWWVDELRTIKEWEKLRDQKKAMGGHCVVHDWGKKG